MKIFYNYLSPVGNLWITSADDFLTDILFRKPEITTDVYQFGKECPVIRDTAIWLNDYFKGNKPKINALPIKAEGSQFQMAVWKLLYDIPYGEIVTYGEIADRVKKKTGKQQMSAQAVGGAVGKNPISIVVPCHRVMGVDGNLTGYGGGIENKLWLLRHEGVSVERFFIPKEKETKKCC